MTDLNSGNGLKINDYFPFKVKVSTNTSVQNLSLYGGAYSISYVLGITLGNGQDTSLGQYINFIPNTTPANPLVLPQFIVNGVTLLAGDTVLLQNETSINATLNGVYELKDQGGAVISGVTTRIWQLFRVDQWRTRFQPVIVPAGTRIQDASGIIYKLTNDTTVDQTVPNFTIDKCKKPDKSNILVDSHKAGLNSKNGVYNKAADVIISDGKYDKNCKFAIKDKVKGGALCNGNLYTSNEAKYNGKGGVEDNFCVNYLNCDNPSVLQMGWLQPCPSFPQTTYIKANIAIGLRKC